MANGGAASSLPHAATSSWFMLLPPAHTESMYLRYTPVFLRMAVANWTVMLCLEPLSLGACRGELAP